MVTIFTGTVETISGKDRLVINQLSSTLGKGARSTTVLQDTGGSKKGIRVYRHPAQKFFASLFGQSVQIRPQIRAQFSSVSKLSLGSYLIRTLTGDEVAANDKRKCQAAFKAFRAYSKLFPKKARAKGTTAIGAAFRNHLQFASSFSPQDREKIKIFAATGKKVSDWAQVFSKAYKQTAY